MFLTLVIDVLSLVLRMLVLECLLTVSFISILTVYLISDVLVAIKVSFILVFADHFVGVGALDSVSQCVGVNEIYFLLR